MNAYPPDLLPSLFKMLASLAVVLGGLLLTLWLFRRFGQARVGKFGGRAVKVLSSTAIGLKKTITLVEIPGAVLVLGVTGERISLLSRIEDADTIRQLRGEGLRPSSVPFAEQLKFFSTRIRDFKNGS